MDLSEFFENGRFSDVKLQLQLQTPDSTSTRTLLLLLHAVVLRTQSSFFYHHAAFQNAWTAWTEAAHGWTIVVQLDTDVQLDAMEVLLKCMYSTRVHDPEEKTPEVLMEALCLADRFLVHFEVKDGLAAALSSSALSRDSVMQEGFLEALFHERLRAARALPSMAPLLQACRDRLQHLYPCKHPLTSLPHDAVVAWLDGVNMTPAGSSNLHRVLLKRACMLTIRFYVAARARDCSVRPCSPEEIAQMAQVHGMDVAKILDSPPHRLVLHPAQL